MGIKVLELKNVDINNPIDMNVLAVGIYTITIMHQGAMIYNTKVSKL